MSNLIEVVDFNDSWDGDILVASLKAKSLFRLRIVDGRVLFSEPIWIGQRIRDLDQLGDGTVVMWTDSAQLLMMNVNEKLLRENRPLDDRTEAIVKKCLMCHHFESTRPFHAAPSFKNIIGRQIASDSFDYSDGLSKIKGTWTEENLGSYMRAPNDFAPGTSMPEIGLDDYQIQAVLKSLKSPTP